MANAMIEILDDFSMVWVLMYRHSKSKFLKVLVVDIPTQILLTIIVAHWSLFFFFFSFFTT